MFQIQPIYASFFPEPTSMEFLSAESRLCSQWKFRRTVSFKSLLLLLCGCQLEVQASIFLIITIVCTLRECDETQIKQKRKPFTAHGGIEMHEPAPQRWANPLRA
jgi:hypothetical protein